MDHKTWLWRKKSNEKNLFSTDKNGDSLKENGEQVHVLLAVKAELENDVKILNDKLSSIVEESNTKDNIVKTQAKTAQEAIAGREKAEVEAFSLKQELDETVHHRIAAEERSNHLSAALKECMQQLRFVRDEQEQRIHDAVMKASKEFEASQMILEEKLANTSKDLGKLGAENMHLTKALLVKENLIEDLSRTKTQVEADLNELMTRLNTTEKANASLNYEVRVLEKELEIRNEEREFNRRTADASHKQHLESIKKITNIESECQRLRVLVRKRLPGPNALAKMKNEVEMLERDRINCLTDHLCAMEEEKKTLKEALNKKINELQFSRSLYTHAASKLSDVESQLVESSKGHTIRQPNKNSVVSYELSVASMSDIGSDDKASCAESWASALVSEVEHFRNGKQRGSPSGKTIGAAEINLMDDFVEMEKLATASVNKKFENSQVFTNEANATVAPLETESIWNSSEVKLREIVLRSNLQSDISPIRREIKIKDDLISKIPVWLQDILRLVWKQKQLTQRNPHEILEDVRVALAYLNHPDTKEFFNESTILNYPDISTSIHPSSALDIDVPITPKINQKFDFDLSKPISKITELIEGIRLWSPDYKMLDTSSTKNGNILHENSQTPSGYMVRVFQWKTTELNGVLERFVQTCYDLLSGKADFNKFAQELSTALDWIMNHCFSLQDVSSMRDAVKKHFDWDETRSESEDHLSGWPAAAALNDHNNPFQKEGLKSNGLNENKELRDELSDVGDEKAETEGSIPSAIDKRDSLLTQLQESEKIISNLQTELETTKKSKEMIEDEIVDQKLVDEELNAQIARAKVDINEVCHSSSLEVTRENKHCCNKMEAPCLELQVQLDSTTNKETSSNELKQDMKQLGTGWEISAASEELARCQETILNLGKQLKALASPKESAPFDKVISSPTVNVTTATATAVTRTTTLPPTLPKNKMIHQRSSLLDQMIAEDNVTPVTKRSDNNYTCVIPNEASEQPEKNFALDGADGTKHNGEDAAGNSLAIVKGNKRSGRSFWKKLLLRKKKGNNQKLPLPFAS